MEQRLFVQQTGQLVIVVSVRVPHAPRTPAMLIQLPLGLFLPAGIQLGVDDGATQNLPVQRCDANGCYAGPAGRRLAARRFEGREGAASDDARHGSAALDVLRSSGRLHRRLRPHRLEMKTDIRHWQSVLREAEGELEATTTRTTLNAAAKRLMRAKAELK